MHLNLVISQIPNSIYFLNLYIYKGKKSISEKRQAYITRYLRVLIFYTSVSDDTIQSVHSIDELHNEVSSSLMTFIPPFHESCFGLFPPSKWKDLISKGLSYDCSHLNHRGLLTVLYYLGSVGLLRITLISCCLCSFKAPWSEVPLLFL